MAKLLPYQMDLSGNVALYEDVVIANNGSTSYNVQSIFSDPTLSAHSVFVQVTVLDTNGGSPTNGLYINADAVASVAYDDTTVYVFNDYTSSLTFNVKILRQ